MKRILSFATMFAVGVFSNDAASPAIRFSTYLSGSGADIPTAIAAGADGSIYVTGIGSADFPQGQTLEGSGTGAFVAKLAPDGATLSYSTLIGGFFPRAIAVDGAGQVYLAGHNFYNGFPFKNAIQSDLAGGFDAAIVKLNAQGNQVVFATYLGGAGDDTALAIAVDGAGAIWVAGLTDSANFPVADQPFQAARAGASDAFLTRLSSDGTVLQYSTYLGGAAGGTQASALAIDSSGRPVVVGRTSSPGFPVMNAFQPATAGGSEAFVAKFDVTGRALEFSTYLGGSGSDTGSAVGLDADGNIYVEGLTGSANFPTKAATQQNLAGEDDIFLTKLQLLQDGSDIVYSTFLGSAGGDTYRGYPFNFGNSDIALDVGGLAVTPGGRVLVVGTTYGADFPLSSPLKSSAERYALDAVATLFEPDGTIGYSTYIGGAGSDSGLDVTATPDGGFAMTGWTVSGNLRPDFPATPGAFQTKTISAELDAIVVKLDTSAPPLPNDNLENPTLISASAITLLAQTGAATKQPPQEPAHNGNAGGKSVWYRWTVPTTGRAIISTDGSNFPTLLAIYYTDRGELFPPVPIAGPVDRDGYSEARFPVVAGEVYHIAVDGRDGASGLLMLSIATSLPANDDFENRQLIPGSTATFIGSNVGATSERGDVGRHTVWWKWTPPATDYYTLTTVGSDFNTALAVFTGSELVSLQRLLFEGAYTNNLARATFRAEAGTEYQIVVLGDEGQTGNIQLNLGPAVRPANDDFANRIPLAGPDELETGTDFDAGLDQAEWNLQLLAETQILTGRMIWWEWTSPIDGAADISAANSVRIVGGDTAGTSLLIFTGDAFPTSKAAITTAGDGLTPASVYLTDVRAGTRYQIGVDVIDWHKPVQYSLKIRAIAPPRIIPVSVLIDTAGKFRARVEGIDGRNYRVTSSANLKDWTAVGEFPAITGEFAFESDVETGYRFFRVEEY